VINPLILKEAISHNSSMLANIKEHTRYLSLKAQALKDNGYHSQRKAITSKSPESYVKSRLPSPFRPERVQSITLPAVMPGGARTEAMSTHLARADKGTMGESSDGS
jgi:hypothetical protein